MHRANSPVAAAREIGSQEDVPPLERDDRGGHDGRSRGRVALVRPRHRRLQTAPLWAGKEDGTGNYIESDRRVN